MLESLGGNLNKFLQMKPTGINSDTATASPTMSLLMRYLQIHGEGKYLFEYVCAYGKGYTNEWPSSFF